MPGRGPRFRRNSLGLLRSCLQTARAALSAQIYGAGRVWGLSYSCRFDGGLHYSASNLHALTAREGPAALLEPGIVLLLARRWWRPGSWARILGPGPSHPRPGRDPKSESSAHVGGNTR